MIRIERRPTWVVVALMGIVLLMSAGCASQQAGTNLGPSTLGLSTPAPSTPALPSAAAPLSPIVIGVVLPRSGDAGALANEELRGIQIAADLVNAGGGVDGRPVSLEVHLIDDAAQAGPVIDSLRSQGANLVLGAYSSELSIPISSMVSAAGLVYWETGSVADRLTGRGLPNVFRVGASSTTLGTDSGSFAVEALAPMLGRTPSTLRVALVSADDDYATEVAGAADRTLTAAGADIVARLAYPVAAPIFGGVLQQLADVKPDVIVLASHIPDGIAFRQQMLAAGLKTGALIGTTMAECVPDFATPLGADAVGIFGSDRPSGAFDPSALSSDARSLYDEFASRFSIDAPSGSPSDGGSMVASSPSDDGSPGADPAADDEIGESALEEGVSGFSSTWALLHDVLPLADANGGLTADAIAAAARSVDLPAGSLPNGAGLHFSSDAATLGQNERAIGLIQQWQAPDQYAVVWPQTFATAPIRFVPLPR
jgi:branched-chain amino acid transport system substrate-binding protein